MPINFSEKSNNGQKILIVVFILIVLTIIFIWLQNSAKTSQTSEESALLPVVIHSKIEINFGFLESQILLDLLPFEEIKPFEGEIGRENPFIPY